MSRDTNHDFMLGAEYFRFFKDRQVEVKTNEKKPQ